MPKTLFKKVKLIAVLLFGLGLTGSQAQEAVPASGGNASGSGGSASYTIGQVFYTTITGTNGSAAQGVQQSYILVVTGLEEAKGISLACSAYPNPATDFVTLKIDASTTLSIQSMSYQLYDINGKLLVNKKVEGNETTISMENLVPATYFLKVYTVGRNTHNGVTDNKREVKTFKIIKN